MLVWFVDVRGLKSANDSHGHEFGDAILVAVIEALRASVRANDLVARWGGDEFVVLGIGRQGDPEDLNRRVDALLEAEPSLTARWSRSVTIGFAAGPPDTLIDELIAAADADMYRRRLGA